MSRLSDTDVRDLAYRLWDEAGRPDGRDLEFWLEAETRLAVSGIPPMEIGEEPAAKPARTRAAKPKAASADAPAKPKAAPRGRAKAKD